MHADEGKVLDAFRARFTYDRGLRRLKPIEHYQRLFPGFEDAIAREYTRLDAEPAASPEARDVPPSAPAEAATRAPSDSSVGPYRLLHEIGRGGQASVHLAEDTRLPRKVALKVFAPGLLPSEQFLARFRREAEAASRLDHPGICTVYEAGVDRDTPYIAMRYVEGRTLAEWIDATKAQAGGGRRTSSLDLPTPPAFPPGENPSVVMRVVALVEKTARALHAAHEAGLVHRDVKPGNIIVTREGEPVLLDFGLARDDDQGQTLTMTGALLGTPAYMSPEQLLAQRIRLDCRTDVYSLGVTLYECLTLKRPFDAPTREGLYQQILSSDADPPRRLNPQIPQELVVVLETAMAKSRDRRYRTALEFAEDLRRLRVHEPIHARPTPPLVRLGRWAQRHPAMATGTVSVFAILALGLAVTTHFLRQSRDEQALTEKALGERTAALADAREATQRAEAEMREKTAQMRHARSLALSNASAVALPADPMCALLLAREAVKVEPIPSVFDRLREAAFHCLPCVVLSGHDAEVNTAAFSPKGDLVVTASIDATARVWDASGRQLRVLKGHAKSVSTAVFSPSGDRILTASQDGTARLWDLDGTQVAEMRGHQANVTAAVFSPDGERIVTCSFDRTARVWDAHGDPVAVLAGHDGRPVMAAFTPDGRRIVTASDDKTAAIWDLTGKRLAVLAGHTNWVGFAAFSPAGDRVVTASEDGTARVWDLEGNTLAVLKGHEAPVLMASFDPHGDRILTCSGDHTARIWDLKGRQIAVLKGHDWGRVFAASFSPSGDRVLTGAEDGTARVWDLTGRELLALTGHSGWVTTAVFSPQGDHVVTASRDHTARLWDLNGREWAVLVGHTAEVRTAAWSPDGERILTASDDTTARVWNPDGREVAVLRGHTGRLRTAAYSPAGDRIVTASEDGTARVWDPGGKLLAVLAGHDAPVCSAAFSPDGRRIVTASEDKTARVWEAEGRCVAVLKGHAWVVSAATFSPDGERIATASWDRTARVWDVRGAPVAVLLGHEEVVYTIEFSPKGDRLVTASFDGTARLWDVRGTQLAVMRDHANWLRAARFAPAGDLVATVSSDRTARLWNLAQAEEPVVLAGHENWVWDAAFSPLGDRIVTASNDRTARIWDRSGAELAVLRGHEGHVHTASFSPRGDRVVTSSADGTARVWLTRNEDVAALAERRTTRDFTRDERERYADVLGEENAKELAVERAIERHTRGTLAAFEVVDRLNADRSLSGPVRAAALRIAAERKDDPSAINAAAWLVVRATDRTPDEYRLAVRRLGAAAAIVPEDGDVLNTLGVAQYRAGDDTDALATLLRSDAINAKAKPPGTVEDVAFLAMCQHRLGHAAAAHDCLVRLRELMKDAKRAAGPDAADFLKETEALVGGD